MDKNRVLALSDGVIAIIMTIMVLELKTPVSGGWQGLLDNKFILISYVVSFTGTYYFWTVHHELFKYFKVVPINSVWLNAVYLLMLSLLPFTTSWVGEHLMAVPAEFSYAVNFMLITLATLWLEVGIRQEFERKGQPLPIAVKRTSKSLKWTVCVNVACCALTFLWAPIGLISVMVMLVVWIANSVVRSRQSVEEGG